jgi:hypothetical protein
MALRSELGCLGLQVVKNKAVEIGYALRQTTTVSRGPVDPAAVSRGPRYTTSTGVVTTVATHYVDLFVTNPPVDQVAAVACELKVLTTAKLTDVHRQQSLRYAHFLGAPVLLIGFAKHSGDVLIEVVVVS